MGIEKLYLISISLISAPYLIRSFVIIASKSLPAPSNGTIPAAKILSCISFVLTIRWIVCDIFAETAGGNPAGPTTPPREFDS